jgi:acetoin utilization deacetylase AcuC-like enzyme
MVYDPAFLEHLDVYPETGYWLEYSIPCLAESGFLSNPNVRCVPPRDYGKSVLLKAHSPEHVEAVREARRWGLSCSARGFEEAACLVRSTAKEVCGGRVASLLEGGYEPPVLSACLHSYLDAMARHLARRHSALEWKPRMRSSRPCQSSRRFSPLSGYTLTLFSQNTECVSFIREFSLNSSLLQSYSRGL